MSLSGLWVLRNGSYSDCVETGRRCRSNGVCVDVGDGNYVKDSDKLRVVFDQVLLIFMKEVGNEFVRPIPAMLGDGRLVDLFKLFWVVREKGGYEWVSDKGLWGLVAKECGMDSGVMPFLKLIYFKYLNQLDNWLLGVFQNGSLGNGEGECGGELGSLLVELGTEFRGLILGGNCPEEKENGVLGLESKKIDNCIELDKEKGNLNFSINSEKGPNGDDTKNYVDGGDDAAIQGLSVAKRSSYTRKRKRESLSGMLNWLRDIAKYPEEGHKRNELGSKEFLAQALRVRESLLVRRKVHIKDEQSLWQKQKMHPSMYEDDIVVNNQSTEGSRCSRRIASSVKSHLCICSAARSELPGPHGIKSGRCLKEKELTLDESGKGLKDKVLIPDEQEPENMNPTDDLFPDDLLLQSIPVGPHFQAEVSEWTGEVTQSDPKWLGIQVWPLENGECSSQTEKDCVGSGKQDSCDCQFPGSVACVRFHTAEKRMQMKLDLGSLFYHWRFDRMGEEISLAWTTEEEKRFKDMIKSNSLLQSASFWANALRTFPNKTREDLVSYYFNVFLIRRRIYQNRVTPKKIDSDDDESEFGSLGGNFGHEAIEIPGSEFLICTQNRQCTDLD